MANPNFVDIQAIYGGTDVLIVSTAPTAITTNAAASGQTFKINSLTVSNVDGTDPALVSVALRRGGTDFHITSNTSIPAGTTLVVLSREVSLYLKEGDSLVVYASDNLDAQAVCSYEMLTDV